MPNLTLYHAAPSRSSIVHWMLEEVGEPYDFHLMSLKKGDNRAAEYLKVNPMGKVPALRHGDVLVTESAAICCYLADAFPQAKLNVPIGDPRRGPYLKWLFFSPSCVEPAMIDHMFPRKDTPPRGRARLRGLRHRDRGAGGGGETRALSPGRSVHRRRRGDRLGAALRHDVQGPAGAAGIRRLCGPRWRSGPAAKRASQKDQELAAAAG